MSETEDYVLIYRLTFSDGGEDQLGLLHRGTQEDCEIMRNLVPAVSYHGDRPVRGGSTLIVPFAEAFALKDAPVVEGP